MEEHCPHGYPLRLRRKCRDCEMDELYSENESLRVQLRAFSETNTGLRDEIVALEANLKVHGDVENQTILERDTYKHMLDIAVDALGWYSRGKENTYVADSALEAMLKLREEK